MKTFVLLSYNSNSIICRIKAETRDEAIEIFNEMGYYQDDYFTQTLEDYNNMILKQSNKCAICGISPLWNNKELVFIVDHIDGNAANNKRDNLRCICPTVIVNQILINLKIKIVQEIIIENTDIDKIKYASVV